MLLDEVNIICMSPQVNCLMATTKLQGIAPTAPLRTAVVEGLVGLTRLGGYGQAPAAVVPLLLRQAQDEREPGGVRGPWRRIGAWRARGMSPRGAQHHSRSW
jgi:hypothetical protein